MKNFNFRISITLVIVSIIILFTRCQNNNTERNKVNFDKKDSSLIKLSDKYIYDYYSTKLPIQEIKRNNDYIEIRIWTYLNPFEPDILVIIKYNYLNKQMNWIQYQLKPRIIDLDDYSKAFHDDIDDILEQVSFDSLVLSNAIIAVDSQEFLKQLDSLSIENLLDQQATLKQRGVVSHQGGTTYYIELSKKGFYKSVSYWNPEHYAENEINNKRVSRFLKFIIKSVVRLEKLNK